MPMLDLSKQSIMGHSMGGHGALTIALKNPTKYKSVSAFSPIVNPTAVPWGEKAFSGYLGEDKSTWDEYDACQLLKNYDGPRLPVLVDQVKNCHRNVLAANERRRVARVFVGASHAPATLLAVVSMVGWLTSLV